MPLTNADIQFCNTYVRPYADWRAKDYFLAKRLVTAWNARGGAVAIPNVIAPVLDGAPDDGRAPIKGTDVNNIINRASEAVADYEATANAKLNTILAVAVNTLP